MADWPRIIEIFTGRHRRVRQVSLRAKNTPQAIIKRITETVDVLDKRIEFLRVKIQEEKDMVKEKIRIGDKRLALSFLKTSKGYEKARETVIRRKDSVVCMQRVIEESTFNKIALDAIKLTHTFMKEAKMPKLEDVDQMLEEIVSTRNEMDEMLTEASTALQPVFDEDELERELDEILSSQPHQASASSSFPQPNQHYSPVIKYRQHLIDDPSPLQKEDQEDSILLLN